MSYLGGQHVVNCMNEYYDIHVCSGDTVFVVCIDCKKKSSKRVLHGLSDHKAKEIFEARGWTIKPTLCKPCQIERHLLR